MPKSIGDKKIKNAVVDMFSHLFNLQRDFTNLPKENTIFVANYPENYYDCFSTMLIPKNLAIIMENNIANKFIWDSKINKSIFRKNGDYNFTKNQIENSIKNNFSVLGYCMKPRRLLTTIRTGLFRIAKELNVSITPVVFDTIIISNFKIIKQNFRIYIGESFYVNEPEKDIKIVKKIFKKKISEFKENKFKKT
jgi:hypothetical protein